jgi:hypothetical protein
VAAIVAPVEGVGEASDVGGSNVQGKTSWVAAIVACAGEKARVLPVVAALNPISTINNKAAVSFT